MNGKLQVAEIITRKDTSPIVGVVVGYVLVNQVCHEMSVVWIEVNSRYSDVE